MIARWTFAFTVSIGAALLIYAGMSHFFAVAFGGVA